MNDILLITPPFTQLNTPYPATAYLKGFLNTKEISSAQMDLGIEVILELFSCKGLTRLFSEDFLMVEMSENASRIFYLQDVYIRTIDAVISFLQGKNPSMARQICSGNFLPQASRFEQLQDLEWAFGTMGIQDKAKHLATLYLEDISDFIVECVDEHFGFSRYAERLGRSANLFDELYYQLQQNPTFIDQIALSLLDSKIKNVQPKLICFSVPFPGNLYSAFRCAHYLKKHFPHVKIAMGGGFPNTELRDLKDKRVFEFFDFITLDDGELPIELLHSYCCKQPVASNVELKRTFRLHNNDVIYQHNSSRPDYKQSEIGTPDYTGLALQNYISVIEVTNPMHSLWSDGRWNKLTMAHGCYWGKCTFCDISLDYIKIYEPVAAKIVVDRMEELIAQTGETGFHFVDEAAPPALMREVALEILRRDLTVSWWTNIRFEKNFTAGLCQLLAASGCIAVSGGLEVASDRLLELIRKGVTVAQVAKVCRDFTENGILVHAYLMYGFPTQTIQETIDSLEMVRQLFEAGIVQSGFWHQFAMTAHSPVGMHPEAFGVLPQQNEIMFANNDIQFRDKTGINHDTFSFGLKKSLYNYMHGIGFDYGLQEWFDFKVPKTTIHPNYIQDCISEPNDFTIKTTSKVLWTGIQPEKEHFVKTKKGIRYEMVSLLFHHAQYTFDLSFSKEEGEWFCDQLKLLNLNQPLTTLGRLKESYEAHFDNFELFWFSGSLETLKQNGLLVL